MTFQKISKTSSAKSETSTTSELGSRPFAPIAKQTTSASTLPKHQEQTQGLLQRKTNLLAIPGLMAQPKTKRLQPIQAKLTIGEPGDKYEQEADAV
ncbi:MAG: hypothetical protein V7K40_13140, partial [Nostoc sp.]|uniref:hypothetical protein n=1 Tax=Nostoc sp. TaxID=1180 RepID=UPI002FFBD780